MALDNHNDVLMCKVFPTSLTGAALEWFKNRLHKSIPNYETLCAMFLAQYCENKKQKKTIVSLFTIRQRRRESLQDFLSRFNMEASEIVDCNPETAIEIFKIDMIQGTKHEGQLIKMIVQTVLMELKRNDMVLFNNLVGIDEHINNIMRLLEVGSSEKRIVGIHGIGGIGKTTIAKCIYNKLLKEFECGSFLADISETAKPHKGIVTLQKQLLADTLKWYPDIADANSGINAIQNRFLRTKVLIVLDDLNEKSEFDWLVRNLDWFGPGTRIIVTTRDKKVLIDLGAKSYEPPDMNLVQSVELFSFHAFRMKFPPIGYEKISNDIASTTGGLPQALEVIGSFLFGKNDKQIWEDTLAKLRIMPDDKVQKALRISYDGLNGEQRNIFLDIACLFIGMDKTYPFYMWDDCGYFPKREIDVLRLLSLVKIESDNLLRMHDQLRDFGREMVRQEDDINPGGRSRLWNQAEAKDVFEENTVTEKVQLLNLDVATCEHDKFPEQSKLRHLQIDGAQLLVGDFKYRLLNLRWLSWRCSPLHFEATNFHMKKLVILDLSHSMIPENWKGWSQIMIASNLKVLDISFTVIEELPDEIRTLKKLEIIDARRSYLGGNIPSCTGRLSCLRYLRSFYSTGIRSLPTSIRTLHLEDCYYVKALPELPSSLQFLYVDLRSLHVTPNLANLVNLQVLWCNKILDNMNQIFSDIVKLSKLQRLDVECSDIMTLPKEIDALSELKFLNLKSFSKLQCILGLPTNLVGLYIVGGPSLEILPDLSNLKLLSELQLYECYKLTKIQGLGKLQSLTSLRIEYCIKLTKIEGLGNLELLESLRIEKCIKLTEIQGLGNLVSLASFCMRWCLDIAELNLLECSAPLASSEMSGYKYPENKPDRSNLNKLKKIEVVGCNNLNKIEGLHILVSLEYLNLSYCSSMVRMPNLSNLKMLRHLLLRQCTNLSEIEGLEALEALEELDIRGCSSLEKVPHLPHTHIQTISVNYDEDFYHYAEHFDHFEEDSDDYDEDFH
ncbi:disease resistance protein L6-like [Cornus florida]|uniref:disease resistance protein L6-like n=1 Tax=Cornus florida TaxID=4283 RepID=UPI002898B21A|nr:disease resistance protein L6-like [Cornus florida]